MKKDTKKEVEEPKVDPIFAELDGYADARRTAQGHDLKEEAKDAELGIMMTALVAISKGSDGKEVSKYALKLLG